MCTVVAVYPVTSAYHARDSTCHAHSLAFLKFEVPFLPIDPLFGRVTSSNTIIIVKFKTTHLVELDAVTFYFFKCCAMG